MTAPDKPTEEALIHALVQAGELDAGVEVLDLMRARAPQSPSILRAQAGLYMTDVPAPEAWRAAMAPWCDGALDLLARDGALMACAIGYRVLARLFPGERALVERSASVSEAVAPLSNDGREGPRGTINQLLSRGAWIEAWEAMVALSRSEPADRALAARIETLRDLLFEAPETRPYGALTPEQAGRALAAPVDVAAAAARIQRAVRDGDLPSALADATALTANASANPRWQRFRDALQRLVQWSSSAANASTDDEPTQRTGPIERADLWLRVGNLQQAREAIRAQLAQGLEPDAMAALSDRLIDLDVVLDGTLPTPVPARPAGVGTGPSFAHAPEERTLAGEEPTQRNDTRPGASQPPAPMSAPPPIARPSSASSPAVAPVIAPQIRGTEDTVPARSSVATPDPSPPLAPHAPAPPTGDVKVGKRKIVRLT